MRGNRRSVANIADHDLRAGRDFRFRPSANDRANVKATPDEFRNQPLADVSGAASDDDGGAGHRSTLLRAEGDRARSGGASNAMSTFAIAKLDRLRVSSLHASEASGSLVSC